MVCSLTEELLDQLVRIKDKVGGLVTLGKIETNDVRKILAEFDKSCEDTYVYECVICGRLTPSTEAICSKCEPEQ